MATYYVATYGSNSNNGTSPTTPWLTVQFALGAASGTNPGLVAGDTVWIAPGTYREVVTSTTLTGTSGNTIKIYGDPAFTMSWSSGSAGRIRLTNFSSDTVVPTGSQTLAVIGDYVDIQDICFDGNPSGSISINVPTEACLFLRGGNITVTRCVVQTTMSSRQVGIECYWGTGKNTVVIDRCSIFAAFGILLYSASQTATYDINAVIKDCFIIGGNTSDAGIYIGCAGDNLVTGARFYNNTIISVGGGLFFDRIGQVGGTTTVVRNNLIYAIRGTGITSTSSITITQSNNTIFAATNFNNVSPSTNNISAPMLDFGSSRIQAFGFLPWYAPMSGSPLISAGSATGAPTIDLYSNTWISTPTVGAIESKAESGAYVPTERNASTITIAPGSTSQSIELYLGVTGLTASTSGLSARYNRTRTASVSIPLVARTIAQAWTAGGFAEVDATNMPGVYRVDLPDAALAAGADDVTVLVRGASGTNGAVMTIKLSSGGLTSAQTASAVWGASPAGYNDATTFGGVVNQIDQTVTGTSTLVQDIPSNVWQEETNDHTTHGTYGYNILRADAPSKEGLVTLHQSGGISRIDADIHAIVNDTAAAAELKGALLHTGGDYITADLLNPVASAQTLRIGPFGVRADGGGADDALDLNQSTAASIVVQMTDGQGTGIDQTSATVQAKVYNVAGALVATYTCTAAYALGGYMSIPMTTTVTGTAGSYIINLWSTVGSTVTVYGPLQLRVRAI